MTREIQEKLVTASVGFDIPPYAKWMDFKIWEEEGPPKGTELQLSAARRRDLQASPAIRRP